MSKSVRYSASPLLASPTPVWRSKLIVAGIALGFAILAGRAAYVQVLGNDFYRKQGEVRFARTLELPASRGRIMDRHGLVLAYNVPAPSIWAIPEDVNATPAQLAQLARLMEVPLPELQKKLADEDKTFVWLKRQVDEPVAKQIAALGIKGIYQRAGYKRQYPDGEAAAHVVGFANVENLGQEGVELAFDKQLAGQAGSRRVIKDRFGRVVEDVGEQVPPVDGRDLQLSIDSKVQFFAYQKLRDAVLEHKAKAGSVVVLDAQSGEVLALANYPSYTPDKRVHLSGAQLRNRALTDTFEPGSTMKAFAVAAALEQGLVQPETLIQTAPGRMTLAGSTISDAHPQGLLSVSQVIQKSSNVGTVKMAMQLPARDMWEYGLWAKTAAALSGRSQRPPAPLQDLATDRASHHELRLWPVGVAVSAGARLHRVCARWRPGAGQLAQGQRTDSRGASLQCEKCFGHAPDAASGDPAGWHSAKGADHRLFRRWQNRHHAQARRQGLRHQQVPRLLCGPGPRGKAAHRGCGDD